MLTFWLIPHGRFIIRIEVERVKIDINRIVSNPLLQSFEGIFKGVVEQMSVNLCCVYGCMPESLLNDKDVRSSGIQTGCKAMPETVRCDSFKNSCFDNPLVEATLDLSGGNPFLHLAYEESFALSEDLLSYLQITMKNRSHFGIEKSGDNQSAFGFDGDLLLQQVYIGNIQINQLGKSNAGMKEEVDNYQITVCLPALLRPDCFQEKTFLILNQENRRFSILVFDLDTDGWIVIEASCVNQPAEEAFNRSPGAIDRRCHFRLSIDLLNYRTREKESIDISGCDFQDIAVKTKMVTQQIQVALLCSNGMWRSSIGELMIQILSYRFGDCQIVLLFLFAKFTVQQCSEKSAKSSHMIIINATVQW